MVGAFAIFATLAMLDLKQMGVGLATAILLDATIVRGVLLPATMKLLGDWNWYLPQVAATGCRASAATATGPSPSPRARSHPPSARALVDRPAGRRACPRQGCGGLSAPAGRRP